MHPILCTDYGTLLQYFLRKVGRALLFVVKAYGDRGSLGITKNGFEARAKGGPLRPLRGVEGAVGPRDPTEVAADVLYKDVEARETELSETSERARTISEPAGTAVVL
jgi:hypothetical protein